MSQVCRKTCLPSNFRNSISIVRNKVRPPKLLGGLVHSTSLAACAVSSDTPYLTVIVNGAVAVAGFGCESVTCSEKLLTPAAVGVPLISA